MAKEAVRKICQVKKGLYSQIKHLCVSPECYAPTKMNEATARGQVVDDFWLILHRWLGDGARVLEHFFL